MYKAENVVVTEVGLKLENCTVLWKNPGYPPPPLHLHGAQLKNQLIGIAYNTLKMHCEKKINFICVTFLLISSGRETEWLFSSKEGQTDLATDAGFARVVIATLGRGHTFTSIDTIKKELSTKVMELAPKNLKQNTQVTIQ